MFTGIISDIGRVTAIEPLNKGQRVTLSCGYETGTISLGASIACDGACMTVVAKDEDSFTVEVSPESLTHTTLSEWNIGSMVNLERPIGATDEFGGHFVTGHVDGVGTVVSFAPKGDFWHLEIEYPQKFGVFLAKKGSVAVNGVSLTVNEVQRDTHRFSLMIIPHTLQETNLGGLANDMKVNLEADLIARYLLAQKEEQENA